MYRVQYCIMCTFCTDCMEGFETSLSLLSLNPDALKVPVGGGWVKYQQGASIIHSCLTSACLAFSLRLWLEILVSYSFISRLWHEVDDYTSVQLYNMYSYTVTQCCKQMSSSKQEIDLHIGHMSTSWSGHLASYQSYSDLCTSNMLYAKHFKIIDFNLNYWYNYNYLPCN